MRPKSVTILALGLMAGLCIPPIVFFGSALTSGLDVGVAISALVDQYRAPRQNLLVLSLVGLLPVMLLGLVLWVVQRIRPGAENGGALALSGLLPILIVLIWTHVDFWPLFLPERVYPGFPHGLGFVIGPLIFAPIGMAMGLVVGRLALGSMRGPSP